MQGIEILFSHMALLLAEQNPKKLIVNNNFDSLIQVFYLINAVVVKGDFYEIYEICGKPLAKEIK